MLKKKTCQVFNLNTLEQPLKPVIYIDLSAYNVTFGLNCLNGRNIISYLQHSSLQLRFENHLLSLDLCLLINKKY